MSADGEFSTLPVEESEIAEGKTGQRELILTRLVISDGVISTKEGIEIGTIKPTGKNREVEFQPVGGNSSTFLDEIAVGKYLQDQGYGHETAEK